MTNAPKSKPKPKPKPSITRRAVHHSARSVLVLFFTAAVAAMLLFSSRGQALLTEWILGALNTIPGQSIGVEGVSGTWPFDVTLTGITVEDDAGIWLTADALRLKLRAGALFQARIELEDASAGEISLLRLPKDSDSTPSDRPTDLGSIHGDLRQIEVDALRVETLNIADGILGAPLRLTLDASLKPANDDVVLTLKAQEMERGGTLAFSIAASPEGLAGTIDAALAASSLKGTINARGNTALSGAVNLHLDGAEPLVQNNDVAFGALDGALTLGGTFAAPQVGGDVNVTTFTFDDRTLDVFNGTVNLALTPASISVSGRGTMSDAARAFPEAAPLAASSGTWDVAGKIPRDGGPVHLDKVTVSSGDLTLDGALTIGETISGTLTANATGAGRMVGVDDKTSRLKATLTTDAMGLNGHGEGRLTFDLAEPPVFGGMLDALMGKTAQGETTLRWDGQVLDLNGLTMRTERATLSGTSTLTLQAGKLDHRASNLILEARDPALLLAGTQGPLRLEVQANGPFNTLTATAKASAASLTLDDVVLNAPSLTVNGTYSTAKVSGNLSAAAQWNDLPVDLVATIEGDPREAVVIQGLKLSGANAEITGTMTVNASSGLARGLLTGRFGNLAFPLGMAGVPFDGAGNIEITLSDPGGQQTASLLLEAENVEGPAVTAKGFKLTVSATDFRNGPIFTGELTATAGTLVGQPFTTLRAEVAGTPEDLKVNLAAKGTAARPFTLESTAAITAGPETRIAISKLYIADSVDLVLTAPAQLTVSPEKITLPRTTLAAGEGTLALELDWDRAKGMITSRVEAQHLPMSAAPWIGANLGLEGVMDGYLSLNGPDTAPPLDADFALALPANAAVGLPDVTAKLSAKADGNRLTIAFTAEGLSPEPARAEADVPFALNLRDGRMVMAMDQPASANITWRGEIAPLWQLLPIVDHDLRGTADINIAMTGTLASPQFTGAAKIESGTYENITLGTVARDLALSLQAEGQNALTFTLTATDGERGKLTGGGRMTRGGAEGLTADLTADFNEFNLVQRDDVHLRASGQLTYAGPAASGTLKGAVHASTVDVRLGGTYVPDIPLLVEMDGAPQNNARDGTNVALDVTVDMPNVRIEGRGLLSSWRGNLALRGTVAKPDLTGNVELDRGEFTFLGQSFDLKSGNVRFTGGASIDPDLSITAERASASVTAIVTISGRAREPIIELSSRPAMARDEVLSRLLFDRGAGQLGPLETVQLANAVTELTNIARDGGVVGVLRRTFGLEVLGFGGASGDAVVVGQRVSRNIYVGVEQSIESGTSQVVVQWRLTPRLSLTSRADAEAGPGIGLSWSRDY